MVLNKMGFVEEEKEYVPGIHVRAASIDKLAALAVDCFGTCNNWTAIVLEVKRLRYVGRLCLVRTCT